MNPTRWARAAVAATALTATITACTPSEIARWQAWHQQDPTAAEAFASRAEIQQQLQRQSAPTPQGSAGGGVWDRLADCESGGNWHINTGNGYFGGLQFLASTWRANGGSGLPHENSREEQIRVAENLRAEAGFSPWPGCARRLGLR